MHLIWTYGTGQMLTAMFAVLGVGGIVGVLLLIVLILAVIWFVRHL